MATRTPASNSGVARHCEPSTWQRKAKRHRSGYVGVGATGRAYMIKEKIGKFAEIRNYFEVDATFSQDVPVGKLIAFYEKAIAKAARKAQDSITYYGEYDKKTEAIIAEAVVKTVEAILASLSYSSEASGVIDSSNIDYPDFQ